MAPATMFCALTSRPMTISPLLMVPISSAPTKVPMMVPLPPQRRGLRAAEHELAQHGGETTLCFQREAVSAVFENGGTLHRLGDFQQLLLDQRTGEFGRADRHDGERQLMLLQVLIDARVLHAGPVGFQAAAQSTGTPSGRRSTR